MKITAETILAGAAAVDVSPDTLTGVRIWLGGYKPDRYATRQAGPIEVRALALGGPGDGLLIVTVDTCLISPLTARRWAEIISEAVPLPPLRIFIATTHTHSGPDLSFLFRGVPLKYFHKVRAGVLDAALRAWHYRRPATMFVGSARHTMGLPRRIKKGQKDWDDEAVVIQWRSEGETVATLINLACHGVAFPRESTLLTPDIPGALCSGSDAAFGGISLFLPRDQGDVNPDMPGKNTYEQYGGPDELERLSAMGIESIRKAVASSSQLETSPLTVSRKNIDVRTDGPVNFLFKSPLWYGGLSLRQDSIAIPLRKFRMGGIRGTAVPGEVLNCLGKEFLKKTGEPSLLFTYTGGYLGYLMTPKTYQQGGYEPQVSPGPVDPSLI